MNNEEYKNLPKKRMGAGALVLNEKDLVLIVKPTYRNHWEVPGGIVELDESPKDAVIREIKEELGLVFKENELRLICLDYMAKSDSKTEALMFIFYAGKLSAKEIQSIKVSEDELSEYKFVRVDEAKALLGNILGARIERSFEAYKSNSVSYFEGAY